MSKESGVSIEQIHAIASLTTSALRRAASGDPDEAAEGRASVKATKKLAADIVKASKGGKKG